MENRKSIRLRALVAVTVALVLSASTAVVFFAVLTERNSLLRMWFPAALSSWPVDLIQINRLKGASSGRAPEKAVLQAIATMDLAPASTTLLLLNSSLSLSL